MMYFNSFWWSFGSVQYLVLFCKNIEIQLFLQIRSWDQLGIKTSWYVSFLQTPILICRLSTVILHQIRERYNDNLKGNTNCYEFANAFTLETYGLSLRQDQQSQNNINFLDILITVNNQQIKTKRMLSQKINDHRQDISKGKFICIQQLINTFCHDIGCS